VHLPAAGPDGPTYAPGDLVTARVESAAVHYALAAAPHAVRRTRAGLAAERALAERGDWRLAPDATAFLAPDQDRGRPGERTARGTALPVV
jgi:hypothetical protein